MSESLDDILPDIQDDDGEEHVDQWTHAQNEADDDYSNKGVNE